MATKRQMIEVGLSVSSSNPKEESLSAILGAIAALSDDDYRQLKAWLVEHDWDRWDEQIGRDSKSGALDFLSDEIRQDKKNGLLEEL